MSGPVPLGAQPGDDPCRSDAPSAVDRRVGLAIGTRVWNRALGSAARFGTVMHHQPDFSWGRFPVCFDDQIWRTMDVSDVTAVSPEREAAIRAQRVRVAPRKAKAG